MKKLKRLTTKQVTVIETLMSLGIIYLIYLTTRLAFIGKIWWGYPLIILEVWVSWMIVLERAKSKDFSWREKLNENSN